MRVEVPTKLKDEGVVRSEANLANAVQNTETKLEARAIAQPRLFAEPREQSGRWRTVVLEADYLVRVRGHDGAQSYAGHGPNRLARAPHQRKDRRVHQPTGDRRITNRRQSG
jgi:hypothetical protein